MERAVASLMQRVAEVPDNTVVRKNKAALDVRAKHERQLG